MSRREWLEHGHIYENWKEIMMELPESKPIAAAYIGRALWQTILFAIRSPVIGGVGDFGRSFFTLCPVGCSKVERRWILVSSANVGPACPSSIGVLTADSGGKKVSWVPERATIRLWVSNTPREGDNFHDQAGSWQAWLPLYGRRSGFSQGRIQNTLLLQKFTHFRAVVAD